MLCAVFINCEMGNYTTEEDVAEHYKYNVIEEWLLYAAILIVLVALGLCNHESIATILRPQIPWLIRWSRAFLSRGQEEVSGNEERN